MPVRDVMERIEFEGEFPLCGHIVEEGCIDSTPDRIAVVEASIGIEGIQLERSDECRLCAGRVLFPESDISLEGVGLGITSIPALDLERELERLVVPLLGESDPTEEYSCKIRRASCRERVVIEVVAGAVEKEK